MTTCQRGARERKRERRGINRRIEKKGEREREERKETRGEENTNRERERRYRERKLCYGRRIFRLAAQRQRRRQLASARVLYPATRTARNRLHHVLPSTYTRLPSRRTENKRTDENCEREYFPLRVCTLELSRGADARDARHVPQRHDQHDNC